MTPYSRNPGLDFAVTDRHPLSSRPVRLWLSLTAIAALLVSAQAQDAPTVITGGSAGRAASVPASSPNALIVKAIETMPTGGGYRANSIAIDALHRSMRLGDPGLALQPTEATPSFCSGATYLVFLAALNEMQRSGQITMNDATLRALLVEGQSDGSGVWGRWNANGPGTARLFFEAGLGRNFSSFDEARPGDFMKIWWNDQIGMFERGHSVVFLGTETRSDGQYVHYWSSNIPTGFGHAFVPRQKMKRVLFSRLEHPELINRVTALPAKDAYLASLLKKASTPEQMAAVVGTTEERFHLFSARQPTPAPVPATRPAGSSSAPAPKGGATSATPAPSASPTPKKNWLGNLLHRS